AIDVQSRRDNRSAAAQCATGLNVHDAGSAHSERAAIGNHQSACAHNYGITIEPAIVAGKRCRTSPVLTQMGRICARDLTRESEIVGAVEIEHAAVDLHITGDRSAFAAIAE